MLRVFPYHKSVLDWLVEDPSFGVDVEQGHACVGKACFTAVMAARTDSQGSVPSAVEHGGSQPSASMLEYALRFGVAHLCLADGCILHLEGLILDVNGFWPKVFALGACVCEGLLPAAVKSCMQPIENYGMRA